MIKITTKYGLITARIPMRSIIGRAFSGVGKDLVKTAKAKQEAPKSGKTYIINGVEHIASAAGEAPAVLSGALLESTRYETKGSDMIFGAGDENTEYAKFLELGTKKMDDRPFIFVSVEENFKNIEAEFDASFAFKVN